MPVVAAAPEKITPLIKRLRVSLEFTDIAPFFVVIECMPNSYNLHAYLPLNIATFEAISFRRKKQQVPRALSLAKARNTGLTSDCSAKITHCYNIQVFAAWLRCRLRSPRPYSCRIDLAISTSLD